MKSLLKIPSLLLAFLCASATALADYHVLTQFKVGGEGGFDMLCTDSGARRLYLSHGTRVEVLDADTGKKVGEIAPTAGVHDIAVAPEFSHGFTTNGKDGTITMFDLKTLQTLKVIPAHGKKPDALAYDADTKQVFVCDSGTGNMAVIDAATGEFKATVALSEGLEGLVFDGRGRMFVNDEDKSVVFVVDTHALKLIATWPLAPGEGPTGLAIDRANHRLFSACDNGKLVVLDSDAGKIAAILPIGEDPDGAVFEPATSLVFASSRGGTLTVVQEESPDKFSVRQDLPTQWGAKTLTLDEKTGQIYLPTAEFGPKPTNGTSHHPPIIPGTFTVLVVGQ